MTARQICVECGRSDVVNGSLYCAAHEGLSSPRSLSSQPETNGKRLPGDKGYLPWLYAKFEAELVTEGEWRQLSRLHEHLSEVVA